VVEFINMKRKKKYTKEFLTPFVTSAKNWSDLLRRLGLTTSGGNHRHIKQCVIAANISYDHFTGRGWARGLTKETDKRVKGIAQANSISNSEVFKKNSSYQPSALYKRLIDLGWDYRCEICGIDEWEGEPLTLHVDHINGEHTDHRLENLRFLCPNCHQQTKTWGSGGV